MYGTWTRRARRDFAMAEICELGNYTCIVKDTEDDPHAMPHETADSKRERGKLHQFTRVLKPDGKVRIQKSSSFQSRPHMCAFH